MIDRSRDILIHNAPSAARIRWATWLLAGFLAAAFFAAEHNLRLVGRQVGSVQESLVMDDYLDETEGGNQARQIGFLSFAALGVVWLVLPGGRRWKVHWVMAALAVLTLAWCAASVTWSINPSLSQRRLAVAMCCLLGAMGVARRSTALELCQLTAIVGLSLVLVSLALELAAGAGPWTGDYRFGGTLHPNFTACYASLACLAAFCLATQSRRKLFWWAVVALCVALVLLTRSRTALGALLVAAGVMWLAHRRSLTRWLAISQFATVTAGLLLLLGAGDVAIRNRVSDTFLLGRRSQAGSLTGRIPLWQELWSYAEDRPWQGYGYESFWSQQHIKEVFESQKWAVRSAHSAFVELMLGIGLVGVVLVAVTVLWGTWLVYRRFRRTGNVGYGFAFATLVFAMANGLLESIFVGMRWPTVVAMCGVMMVAFFGLHRREVSETSAARTLAGSGMLERASIHKRLRSRLPLPDRRWSPPFTR